MIRYALTCSHGHRFDSWFQSAGAYDTLAAAGQIGCPECGDTVVRKSLMAPDVRPARAAAAPPPEPQTAGPGDDAATPTGKPAHPLAPDTPRAKALAALKQTVEAHSDYVGEDFVQEARAIHEGSAPERSIYGEAKPQEAIALIEEGVPVAPLPFMPTRKVN